MVWTGLEAAIHKNLLHDNLDVITAGVFPLNPAELLMNPVFADTLKQLETQYDLVIIDTPSILAVSDAAIVAKLVGTSFMVVWSGQQQLREITAAARRFE